MDIAEIQDHHGIMKYSRSLPNVAVAANKCDRHGAKAALSANGFGRRGVKFICTESIVDVLLPVVSI